MSRRLLLVCLLLAPLGIAPRAVYADESAPMPVVEISVSPAVVTVGEPVTLQVAVYVPTWFVKPPVFPSFEVPNAVTRRPPDSSRPTTKRIRGESWAGVTRSYRIYPLQAAQFVITSAIIDTRFAQPGSDPLQAQPQTGDISFRAVVPAGAESLDPYVAGTRLELERRIEGDLENLAVGDALVVTYEATLEGLPAIFIPEIMGDVRIPGVSVYPEQPVVSEGSPARRIEKLTFVFNSGGTFDLPGARIAWWNRDASTRELASLEPLALTVAGPVPKERAEPTPDRSIDLVRLVILAALALVLLRLGSRGLRRLGVLRAELRARRHSSEAYAWRELKHALAGGDARRVHLALTRWTGRLGAVPDPHSFARRYGSETLEALLQGLGESLFGAGGRAPEMQALERELSVARQRFMREQRGSRGTALPTLNP